MSLARETGTVVDLGEVIVFEIYMLNLIAFLVVITTAFGVSLLGRRGIKVSGLPHRVEVVDEKTVSIQVITDNIPTSLNSCYAYSRAAQTWAWFKASDDDSGQELRGVHVTALTCLGNDKMVYEVPADSLG